METFYIERDGRYLHVGVLAEVPPKKCTFCGKTFYLQEGRSKKGQYRATGVQYCSANHARAAAMRRFRAKAKIPPPI